MNISITDLIYTLPLWSLALFSFVPLLTKALSKNKEMRPLWTSSFASLGFLFSGASLFIIGHKNIFLFSKLLRLDHSSWFFSLVILFWAASCLLLFIDKNNHVTPKKFFSEFIFLFINSTLGLCLVMWSNSLISAFIAIEHISLCFYLMIPLARDHKSSIESGLKYFILGSVGAAIFLLGISFIYLSAGALDFNTLLTHSQTLIQTNRFFIVGLSFVCIALLFKAALFPFQFWLPDVYQGSATPLTAFMSSTVKAAVFILLLKLVLFGGFITHSGKNLMILFQWLSILSLVVGHVSALFQQNFKRMLIYSSIGHAGYMIMALLNPDIFSVSSLFYYLISYGAAILGSLAFVMFFEGDKITGFTTDRLKGLYKMHPFYSLILTWFLLNLAGLPLTAGFFAKLFIFESLAQKELWWMLFWAILSSAVALVYYLKPIVLMFSEQNNDSEEKVCFNSLPWVKVFIILQLILSIALTAGAGYSHSWIIELWKI